MFSGYNSEKAEGLLKNEKKSYWKLFEFIHWYQNETQLLDVFFFFQNYVNITFP